MEHNLFKENTAYCYCSYKNNSDIKEIDLSLYSDVQSIVEHVKEILRPIISKGANIIIFGNLYDEDFFAANNGVNVDFIFRDSQFESYINNWEDIVNDFESEINDENPCFESDGYMMGESTFNWVPENETDWFRASEEITEDGWDSISDNFIESVENIVENYPIFIIENSKSDFDDIEYTSLKVRFEIEPYCKNSISF